MNRKDQLEELYTLLGGGGACTAERFVLLTACHAGAITVQQLDRLGMLSSTSYCRQVLKHLTEQGYLEKQTGAIPNVFMNSRNMDLYVPTDAGRQYSDCFILTGEPPAIRSRRDAGLFHTDHLQLLHNTGVLDFFYTMLQEWDQDSSFAIESVIPGAAMRPDCEYRHTGEAACVYYVEEDTGTQRAEDIQRKFDNYAAYFLSRYRAEGADNPMVLADYVLIFHLNDLRAIGNQKRPAVNLSSRLYRLDRKYLSEHGEHYYIRSDSREITPQMKYLLPDKERYTREDILAVVRELREKQSAINEKMTFEASRSYTDVRKSVIGTCTGLERCWQYGLQTLAIPGRYDRLYLQVCIPIRYRLPGRVYRMLGFGGTAGRQFFTYAMEDGRNFALAGVCVHTDGNRYLVVENISHDISGAYRADIFLSYGSVSLLLIADSLDAVTEFLHGRHISGGMQVFCLTYEDIFNQTYTLYRCETGEPVPFSADNMKK